MPGSTPNYNNFPRLNSLGRMAFQQAMVQQALMQQRMLQQQILEQQREARREWQFAQCQDLGKKDEERREAVWARLHEEAEKPLHRNLQVRAQRYLSSAARFETEGNFKAAAAYYRLILRSLPETPAASEAKAALEQGLRQFSQH